MSAVLLWVEDVSQEKLEQVPCVRVVPREILLGPDRVCAQLVNVRKLRNGLIRAMDVQNVDQIDVGVCYDLCAPTMRTKVCQDRRI